MNDELEDIILPDPSDAVFHSLKLYPSLVGVGNLPIAIPGRAEIDSLGVVSSL